MGRVRIMDAPGGHGMEAERVSSLLRKMVTQVESSDPTPILEVPNLNSWDLQELHRNDYRVKISKFNHHGAQWITPRFS